MSKKSGYAYTDGACASNGQPGARAGTGTFWGNNHPNNTSERSSGRQTNNSAAIQAAASALETAGRQGYDKMTIYTDSQLVVDAANNYIPKWESNGWKKANGKPVVNRSDFERLNAARANVPDVRFKKVDAHSGNYGNNKADRFAREGARKNN